MNGSAMDALIGYDSMKTMLKLPKDATEQDVPGAVLTEDYDDLKGDIAPYFKALSEQVFLYLVMLAPYLPMGQQ